MGEQRSTAPGPMATKASDPLLCTLLFCADCVVGALGRAWGGLNGDGLQDRCHWVPHSRPVSSKALGQC